MRDRLREDKRREIQDKRREIMEETIRRDFEVQERIDTRHRSPNIGGEERWELFESEYMAYRNPSKSSSHSKHLHDAHRQNDKYGSGHSRLLGDRTRTKPKETTRDTLVQRYIPVGARREPVGGLHRHSIVTN